MTSFTPGSRKVHSDRRIGIAKLCSGNQDDENLNLAAINCLEDERRCGTSNEYVLTLTTKNIQRYILILSFLPEAV